MVLMLGKFRLIFFYYCWKLKIVIERNFPLRALQDISPGFNSLEGDKT